MRVVDRCRHHFRVVFSSIIRRGQVLLDRAYCVPALAGLAALVLLPGLARHGILDGNESLYVESAREMLVSGTLVIPTLDDLPYLEKPPLFVWLLALSASLFGTGEMPMRAVSALVALLFILASCRWAVLLGTGRERCSVPGYLLVTSVGFIIMARVAMPDMLFTVLFSGAALNLLAAIVHDRRDLSRWAAALLGLATLTKGFLAPVLLGAIVTGYALWQPDQRRRIVRLLADPVAVSMCLSPIILWLLAAEWQLPGTVRRFVVDEHVLRFLGTREPRDYYSGSLYYYIPRLFLFFFPWSALLPLGWLAARHRPQPNRIAIRRYLWLCVGVPFVFFSFSRAKANYYIVICLPAMAFLAADYLPSLLRDHGRGRLILSIFLPALTLVSLVIVWWWLLTTGQTPYLFEREDGNRLLTILLSITVLAILAVAIAHAGQGRSAVVLLGGLTILVLVQADQFWTRAEAVVSSRSLAEFVRRNYPDASVLLYQDYEACGALPIYLGRSVPIVDSQSMDLWYGHKLFPHHPNFIATDKVAQAGADTLLVVARNREESFSRSGLVAISEAVATIGKVTLYRLRTAPLADPAH